MGASASDVTTRGRYPRGARRVNAAAYGRVPMARCLRPGVGRLDRRVELDRVASLLARAARGSLRATERHMMVDTGGRQIDRDDARLEAVAEHRSVLEGRGAHARRQPELGVVRQR